MPANLYVSLIRLLCEWDVADDDEEKDIDIEIKRNVLSICQDIVFLNSKGHKHINTLDLALPYIKQLVLRNLYSFFNQLAIVLVMIRYSGLTHPQPMMYCKDTMKTARSSFPDIFKKVMNHVRQPLCH